MDVGEDGPEAMHLTFMAFQPPLFRKWTLGRRRGRRALVYRYVWRDDLSDTFDESVRV